MKYPLCFIVLVLDALVACTSQSGHEPESTSTGTAAPKISLAQWSLHRALFSGEIDNLDFPRIATDSFDIHAVEFVSQFFQDKVRDTVYLRQLKDSCSKYNVQPLLIMVDGAGELGDTSLTARNMAVADHFYWLGAAMYLGCKGIRVNANGLGPHEAVKRAAADGLITLGQLAQQMDLKVLVENHGMEMPNGKWNPEAFSTHGQRLASLLEEVRAPAGVGALPDFGNFVGYDPYQGVEDLLPYAGGISAKAFDFDSAGEETTFNYARFFKSIKAAGYTGYIGIEYEGPESNGLTEYQGIRLTKALIEKHATSN